MPEAAAAASSSVAAAADRDDESGVYTLIQRWLFDYYHLIAYFLVILTVNIHSNFMINNHKEPISVFSRFWRISLFAPRFHYHRNARQLSPNMSAATKRVDR